MHRPPGLLKLTQLLVLDVNRQLGEFKILPLASIRHDKTPVSDLGSIYSTLLTRARVRRSCTQAPEAETVRVSRRVEIW